jgi:hypothetical protein
VFQAKKNPKSQDNLEWQMENFLEYCEICGKKVRVHAFCSGNNEGRERSVYAHCTNEECGKKGIEVSYQEVKASMMRCSHCNETVMINGSRHKTTKHREATYVSCNTKGCRKQKREICYLGEISVKQKPTHYERQVIIKQIMNSPRVGLSV